MITIAEPDKLHTYLRDLKCKGESVGLVPTMGALHEGHAALIRRAVDENDHCAVSIFVNPTQFGPNEDLDKYPRTIEDDLALCRALGVKTVFLPDESGVYPEGKNKSEITFSIRTLDKILCGASRPGHMNGVVQVVTKLFNICIPDRAYFGKKDYQQLAIIQTMTRELFFPIEIVPCEIVREADGLAMSSRNRYLNPEERKQALYLSKTLRDIQLFATEGAGADRLLARVEENLKDFPLIQLDYIEIVNGITLERVENLTAEYHPVALIAAFCGKTRLIDNIELLRA